MTVPQMFTDLKLAWRSLLRVPGYSAAVVGTLAVGIGAATALYSALAGTLFFKYDFHEPGRLVRIEAQGRDNPYPMPTFFVRHLAYRERARSVEALAGGVADVVNLVVDGEPEGVSVARVTANFFGVLSVTPILGRAFLPHEEQLGADGVAVLTYQIWRDRFGRDPGAVGKLVRLNERNYEVVGVLGEDFRMPPNTPSGLVFLPYVMPAVATLQTAVSLFPTIARLKPGVTREEAQAELRTILPEAGQPYAEIMGRYLAVVVALDSAPEFPGMRRFQVMRRTAVGAVLFLYLIACVNAGSLMLVRALGRRREVGVRMALGGGRWAGARPLIAEALVLTVVAIGLGVLVAIWLMPVLFALAPGGADNLLSGIKLNWESFVFVALLGLLTCLTIASGPAWRVARLNVNEVLKDGAQGGGGSRRTSAARSALVVAEAALAVILLTGAGLMVQTFQRLQAYHSGIETENRFRISLVLPREEDLKADERLERYEQVVERLQEVPGVSGAELTAAFNPANYSGRKLKIEGRPEMDEIEAQGTSLSPQLLDLIGIPLRAGRPLSALRPGGLGSVVISETMARTYFPGQDPIGKRLELNPRDKWEIMGVVGDVRSARQGPKSRFYFPYWQRPSGGGVSTIVLRTEGPPGPAFYGELRRAVLEVEPRFAVTAVQRLDQQFHAEIATERFILVLFEVLSTMALLLALFGLFALMAFAVEQRRTEMGIRLVLGATPGSIERLVMHSGLRLAATGVLIGFILAWGLARTLEAVLYQTSAFDPIIYGVVGLLMLSAAIPACWLPARKASKVEVNHLLRSE